METSCLDSYAGTVTRLKNRLEGEKNGMFLWRFLFRSQRHISKAYAEGHAILHHKLPVHGIVKRTTLLLPFDFIPSHAHEELATSRTNGGSLQRSRPLYFVITSMVFHL